MTKAQVIRSPSGEELVVIPRDQYEDMRDALIARKARRALREGNDEILAADEVKALLAAPTPLGFWRKKRGLTQEGLAASASISQSYLSELESGRRTGDIRVLRRLAALLGLLLEDLVIDQSIEPASQEHLHGSRGRSAKR